mgnify:CR=1 FL=1
MKDFNELFNRQKELQKQIKHKDDIDIIDPVEVYNSATAMMVEIGEMLQEDTRWKPVVTHSKKIPHYSKDKFKEEAADVLLFFMNVLVYAGVSYNEFLDVVDIKMQKNIKRLVEEV